MSRKCDNCHGTGYVRDDHPVDPTVSMIEKMVARRVANVVEEIANHVGRCELGDEIRKRWGAPESPQQPRREGGG